MTTCYSTFETPVGKLFLQGDDEFLTGLYLPNHRHWRGKDPSWKESTERFFAIREQLKQYFAGERQHFDIPIKLEGTPFQKRVWRELLQIPFGSTMTYAQLAQRLGKPTATRAVGSANGRNPISIIVPCHRVIGANGDLTGYGGGIDKKEWLLAWERSNASTNQLATSVA